MAEENTETVEEEIVEEEVAEEEVVEEAEPEAEAEEEAEPEPEPEPEPEEEAEEEAEPEPEPEPEEEAEEEVASEDIPPAASAEPMTKDEIFEDAKENFDVELDRRMKLSDLKEQWKKLDEGQTLVEDAPKMRVPKTVKNIFTGNVFAYNEYFKGNPDLEIIEWEDSDGND